ncbi:MAG: bifunctional tetrahydrofolate synthase/dihydrofolate synthase [Exilibacterium sp.]
MRFNSLEAWLAWLEQLHPKEIELGLARIGIVAERLELVSGKNKARQQPAPRIVTIAGTNGKGSCVATLEALLIETGYRVGSYTSPHLFHYCERIRIQGCNAAPETVCAAFEKIERVRDGVSLTYFEFGTLAAMELFLHGRQSVDIVLLEVGLGGRLDATNLWDADVAVVTSIDLDHEIWLGSDRDSIAREKAGIFRRSRPAICADPTPPAAIAAAAADCNAPLLQLGREFGSQVSDTGATWSWWGRASRGEEVSFAGLPLPNLPLPSVAAALQVCNCLEIKLQRQIVQRVMEGLELPGRLQKINYKGLEFILDVAHNPAAATYLATKLAAPTGAQKTFALVAMMADKDRRNTLCQLRPLVDYWFVSGLPGSIRAASAEDLETDLNHLGGAAVKCDTVAAALEQITREAAPGDRVLVLGSFLTVAAALEVCKPKTAE